MVSGASATACCGGSPRSNEALLLRTSLIRASRGRAICRCTGMRLRATTTSWRARTVAGTRCAGRQAPPLPTPAGWHRHGTCSGSGPNGGHRRWGEQGDAGERDGRARIILGDESARLLVASVRDYAIYMLDVKGDVLTVERGARVIRSYTADEVLRTPLLGVLHHGATGGRRAGSGLVASVDAPFRDRGWRLRKGGERFWANVVITAIVDDDGVLRGFARSPATSPSAVNAEEGSRSNRARRAGVDGLRRSLSRDARAVEHDRRRSASTSRRSARPGRHAAGRGRARQAQMLLRGVSSA